MLRVAIISMILVSCGAESYEDVVIADQPCDEHSKVQRDEDIGKLDIVLCEKPAEDN